jgi:RNA polymerase sigma-70 factor (ECF subfamily)
MNGLPGVVVHGPDGPIQTAALEIEGGVIRALYVVRNPDKLRHLAAAPLPHQNGRGRAVGS